MTGRLAPLDVAERQTLIKALRAESHGGEDRSLSDRLKNLRCRTFDDEDANEYVTLQLDSSQACILINPAVADTFVCDRLADIAPLLSYVAARSSWRGEIGLNLGDGGRAGQISFCFVETGLLIPDCYFLSNNGYAALRAHYAARTDWDGRATDVFWRGSTTGVGAVQWTDLQRAKLCQIASDAPECLSFDVGFTHVVQQRSKIEEQEIRDAGFLKPWVDADQYANFKYHVDIDGNSDSWGGLFLKLLSGGLIFKVDSPLGYVQWYYPRLKPWLHYIPIDINLSNLTEMVLWAIRNDDRARQIATAGRQLAESVRLDKEAEYTVSVIETALWRSGAGSLVK